MSGCGCSARNPTANGFASMGQPRAAKSSNSSRALFPGASTSRSDSSVRPSARRSPAKRPSRSARSIARAPHTNVQPPRSSSSRIAEIAAGRTSEPTCGLPSTTIRPTFPKRANSSTTLRTAGWWMRVPSFPSVYAPAPPSPKFMFDSGSSAPLRMSVATSRRRGLTGLPRSTTMDVTPRSSSVHAQKRPAGPAPRMRGGAAGLRAGVGAGSGAETTATSGGVPRIEPSTSTSTFTSQRTWPLRRASSERRTTVASRRCSAERPSRSAARRVRSDSSSSSQSGMFEIR